MTHQEIRDDERRRIADILDQAVLECRQQNPDDVNPDKIECMEQLARFLRTDRDALIHMALIAMVDEIRAERAAANSHA